MHEMLARDCSLDGPTGGCAGSYTRIRKKDKPIHHVGGVTAKRPTRKMQEMDNEVRTSPLSSKQLRHGP